MAQLRFVTSLQITLRICSVAPYPLALKLLRTSEAINCRFKDKATSLMGMNVQNLENEKLGTVKDLVFDPTNGKISYAVLSVRGFLGVAHTRIAVPMQSLRAQPGEKYPILNMTKEQAQTS